MPASDSTPLLPERAFVVEFHGLSGLDDHLSGRVEHVVSGKAARFESAAELLDFVRGVLRDNPTTPGGHPRTADL